MHEVLVNCLGGLSLPRISVVRLIDRPDMTLDVTVDVKQQCNNNNNNHAQVKNGLLSLLHCVLFCIFIFQRIVDEAVS